MLATTAAVVSRNSTGGGTPFAELPVPTIPCVNENPPGAPPLFVVAFVAFPPAPDVHAHPPPAPALFVVAAPEVAPPAPRVVAAPPPVPPATVPVAVVAAPPAWPVAVTVATAAVPLPTETEVGAAIPPLIRIPPPE